MSVQLDMVVTRFEPRGGDVVFMELARHDGGALPKFEAGAHIDLFVGPDLIRPYSICSNPAVSDHYQLGILRDPASRGGSEVICTQWGVGMPVRTSVPRNLFLLDESASHSVLVGGGIGITPLLAMAHRLTALGRSFELHYCVRDEDRAAFVQEIETSEIAPHARIHYSTNRRFSVDVDVGAPASQHSHFYVCGPQGFMGQIADDARHAGWSEVQIHSEQFTAEADLTGEPFTVLLANGTSFEVPGGRSIAQCLIEAGYEIEISCEQGICGTCVVDVLDGEPDHRDQYLTEEERDSNRLVTLCCSRSHSATLALDFP